MIDGLYDWILFKSKIFHSLTFPQIRAQNRQKKLEALADTNEKLQSLQALNQLKKSAKLQGSRTTLIGVS